MKYEEPKPGEWVQPWHRGYKLACCDCGLVHRMDFRVHKGRVQFRAWRNERSTGQMRRWKTFSNDAVRVVRRVPTSRVPRIPECAKGE